MKCLKCKRDKTYIKKRLVGKRGFFEGKTITLSFCTGPYGGRIFAHMESNGPVRQYGIRTSWSSTTVMIHEEDVASVEAGGIRLMALVHELEAQGWEVQNNG